MPPRARDELLARFEDSVEEAVAEDPYGALDMVRCAVNRQAAAAKHPAPDSRPALASELTEKEDTQP